MNAKLVIAKQFSAKQKKEYLSTYLQLGDSKYFINLTHEPISVLLDCKVREIQDLQVGFCKEFDISGVE